MPSETIDLQSLSDDIRFPSERQIGFWKSDTVLDQRAYNKPVTPSNTEKIIPVESQIARYLEHTAPFTKPHQKVNQCIDSRTVGAGRVANQSPKFLEPINQGPGTKSSFGGENGFPSEEGTKANTMNWQSENSLFSSSFSEFFTRKLNLSSNNAVHGNSIDEPFESLEEVEAQTIGNLLPSDDDLFSGVIEGLDSIVQPNGAEDAEELDVFSSVGGMDLGDDSPTVVQNHYEFPKDNGTSSGFNSALKAPFADSTIHHGFSSSVSNGLTSMVGVGSFGNQSVITESGRLPMKFDVQGATTFHPHPLPEYQNGNHPLPGRHYSWSNSYHPEPPSMMWPNLPSFVNGMSAAARPTALLHGIHATRTLNTGIPIINYHVGSAPTVNASLWDRRHAYGGESSNSGFHPGSLGNMTGLRFLHPCSPVYNGRGQSIPVTRSVDSPHEHARSRRNDGSMNQADKKHYELDIERIIQGEDKRTTLMLKNIPNKYTSKMLLAAIDERGGGTYDFIYLPIDFKNKCNMGYAFINMIEPSQVITFYQAFNGKKWEKFNSEKVASLAYGRIQGKEALVAHFQNSSLMNEDKRCRPILFNTDGLNVGDQVPFPVGINARTRPGKARSAGHEENNIESPSSSENEVNSSNGETCSSG